MRARTHTHTHTHLHRLPGVASSVGLTPFPVCLSVGPGLTSSLNETPRSVHSQGPTERYMEKETGAKIETSMCVRRGTCSDKHLWKQTHASRASGSARRDAETHMCRHAEQHGC